MVKGNFSIIFIYNRVCGAFYPCTRGKHRGKTAHTVKVPLTVRENAFVVGKDLRDVLWPVSCVVLSVDRTTDEHDKLAISAGDVITVHYKTYDPIAVAEEVEALVGDQPTEIDKIMRPV